MTIIGNLSRLVEPVPLALYITAVLYTSLGLFAFQQRNRGIAAATPLAWTLAAMAWWSFGYGMEIHFHGLGIKLLWAKLEYPAIVSVPLFWFFFALEYTGQSAWLTRRRRIAFSVIPVVTVLLIWTNEYHNWMYAESQAEIMDGMSLLMITHGWYFWVHLGYSYLLLGFGSLALLINTFRTRAALYRVQSYLILLAVVITWIGNLVYVTGLFPIHGLDLTPFIFLPTGIIMTWAMARYHFLDIVPPAQNVILQSLSDGVILLDARQRVLYLNRAAEILLHADASRAFGQPAQSVCTACVPAVLAMLGSEPRTSEITLEVDGRPRYFETRVSPHYFSESDRRASRTSHLILLHDMTERRQTQAALKTREAILQAVNYASELFLKSGAWDRHTSSVLEQLGRAAGVSRTVIFEQHDAGGGRPLVSQRYVWAAEGIDTRSNAASVQDYSWLENGLERWVEILQRGDYLFGLARELPLAERDLLAQRGVVSLAVMPIFAENEFWGFIGFEDCERERTWSEAELDALRTAAGMFGAALTRQSVERRLWNRQRSQALLQEIIRLSLSMSDIQEMAQTLVDHMGLLIGADHCFLSLWDEARQRVIPMASYGVEGELYRHMQTQSDERTLTASALEAGHLLVVDNLLESSHVSPRLVEMFGTHSALALPMIVDEKKLGAILIGFILPHRFTEEEVILSEQAAGLVTLALAKFQAVEEATRRAEEAETLRRAGVAISETINLQEATTRILEQLAFVIPHDSASVQLLRGDELEIIGGEGWENPASIIGVRFPIPADNPNTVVIQTRKPYLVDDVQERFPAFRDVAHASHIRSWLGVPLIVHNQVIGLLAIDSREVNHFNPDNIELVTAFAGQVAVAIENARLFDETQRLAITDGLTGILNHRHFIELARAEFERTVRFKHSMALILFDIDHFKKVNDKYGHPIGDQVLVALAKLCQEKLREADPIARYGGEEFVALVIEANAKAARLVAERLRKEVEKMVIPSAKGDLSITVSIGVAEYNKSTPNLEVLIARADQAMYVAKHKGRNRVCVGK